jgi:hypothetical protein
MIPKNNDTSYDEASKDRTHTDGKDEIDSTNGTITFCHAHHVPTHHDSDRPEPEYTRTGESIQNSTIEGTTASLQGIPKNPRAQRRC